MSREQPIPVQVDVFNLQLQEGYDLEIVPGSFQLEDGNARRGNTVYCLYTIRNRGSLPAERVFARVYKNEPWKDENQAKNTVVGLSDPLIERLDPGEEVAVRVRWDPDPANPTPARLFATVVSNSSGVEKNLSNNVASMDLNLIEPPNLALDQRNIKASRNYISDYETIKLTVPFENKSDRDFLRAFKLTAYAITQEGNPVRKFNRRFDRMLSGEKGSVQFDWIVLPGEQKLKIELNEDRDYLEASHDDNIWTLDLPYIMSARSFPNWNRVWEFTDFSKYGTYHGVRREGTGSLTVAGRPRAIGFGRGFETDYLVEGEYGAWNAEDNLWGYRNGQLLLLSTETADPLKFRFPASRDDHTTIYDVYINHVGESMNKDLVMPGDFRYRLEDDLNWKLENSNQRGMVFLQRVDSVDDAIDIMISPPKYPSFNHLFNIDIRAAIGVYESPMIRFEHPPRGRMIVDAITPGLTKVEMEVRYGATDDKDIVWDAWLPVSQDGAIPAGEKDRTLFQWRARLVDSMDASPELNSVLIEIEPGAASELIAAGETAEESPESNATP